MEGVIATLLATGVIAALMIVGIRTKLPPPDPDWREHLPPPPPPPSKLEWVLIVLRFAWYPVLVAVAFTERKGLILGIGVLWIGTLVALNITRIVRVRRARRAVS